MKKVSFFVACFMLILVVGCSKSLKVTVKDKAELEYGDKLDDSLLFDKENSDEDVSVKEVKNFDSKKTGEQEITVVFSNSDDKTKEETMKVTVKDTKKPVIKFKKEKVEITEGDKFDAAANIESVKDPVDGDLKKSDDKKLTKNGYIITSGVDIKKAGSYTVKVIAFDVNGNKTEGSYKVTVKEKPQEQAPVVQQPITQTPNQSSTQTSNNSGYSNNQGSGTTNNSAPITNNSGSASKPTQSKPQQTCQAGVIHPNAIGNTGKIFNSKQEAINWANAYIEDCDNKGNCNILNYTYSQVFDYCENIMNKWTIHFSYQGESSQVD